MFKVASAFLSLVLATSMSAGSTAPAAPKKSKKAPEATVQHSAIIQAPHSETLPVTTSSSEARTLYEAGIRAWETLQTDSALKRWRVAVNLDPHFALAHLLLSYCTPDPAEGQTERQKAKSLATDVSPGERLLITWFSGVRENDYLSGITAMNDLVQQYPKDEQLLVWAGSWLFHQKEYELAQKRLEQAVAIDADFAGNEPDLTAYQGDYNQALIVMQRITLSCCPTNPTRRIPMQKSCEWQADTMTRSSTTAWRCTSIPTSTARRSALPIRIP